MRAGGWRRRAIVLLAALSIGGEPSLAQQAGSRPDSARIHQEAVLALRNYTRAMDDWRVLRHAPQIDFFCEHQVWPYCFGLQNGGIAPGNYGTQRVEFRTSAEAIPQFMRSTFDRIARRLFTGLDDAQRKLPGDGWVAGQRVFHQIERKDFGKAEAAATSCKAERWWCAALLGFVAHSAEQYVRADSAFTAALAAMPHADRCTWEDLGDLIDGDDDAGWYKALSCSDRLAVNDTIWWLADPLYIAAGNERRTAHYTRLVYGRLAVDFIQTLPPEFFKMGPGPGLMPGSRGAITSPIGAPTVGEPGIGDACPLAVARHGTFHPFSYIVTRMGVPSHEVMNSSQCRLLVFAHPLQHFLPSVAGARTPFRAPPTAWELNSRSAQEYYRSRHGRFSTLENYQLAYFRRGDTTRLVTAADIESDTILARSPLVGISVAVSTGPQAPPIVRKESIPGRGGVFVLDVPRDSAIVSIEAAALGVGASRMRLASGAPSMPMQRVTMSDLLLLDHPLPLVTALNAAIPRIAPNIRVPANGSIGLFWELYGTADGDSVTYALSVNERQSGSVLDRVGRALGAISSDSTRVGWVEHRQSGGHVAGQGVTVSLAGLSPGWKIIRLEASVPGQLPVSVTREIEVVGPGGRE
jgi:hypothetical protein